MRGPLIVLCCAGLLAAGVAAAHTAAAGPAATTTTGTTATTTGTTPTTTVTLPATTTAATTTAPATTAATTTTASATAPAATSRPLITGPPRQGTRLTAMPGTWTSAAPPTYTYQWYRCDVEAAHCQSIHGATGLGYKTVAADVGKTIALTVKATSGGASASAYANAVGPVVAATTTLFPTAQPQVTGTATAGMTLTAGPGTWQGGTPTFSYAWQSCNENGRICSPIAGATNATYAPTRTDAGHTLLASVTATVGSVAVVTLSTASDPVTAPTGPVSISRPVVTGAAQQGKRLAATSGSWTGGGKLTYAYQWYRCDLSVAHCSSIHGATASGYRLGQKDIAHTIALTVKATDSSGSASAYSSAVGPVSRVSAKSVSTKQPTLTGAPAIGGALTAGLGTWTKPASKGAFAWLRCNANGRLCATIDGATGTKYTLQVADAGHVVLARVQATTAGTRVLALSVGVGPIAGGP